MSLSEEQGHAIEEAIFEGKKIIAIKLHREATGEGLKESKDFVDALEADLRRESPERFANAAAPRRGCAAALLLGCGVAASAAILTFAAARPLIR